MKAVYTPGRSWVSSAPLINKEKDYLSLSGNNWDDYSYKTTLNAALYINGEISLNFQLKILIENISYTASHLNKLCKEGWDGIFPIPGENYISVVSDIDFYKITHSRSKDNITKSFLSDIRDAGYVINILNDHKAIELSQTEGFNNSLLRESGANKSYQDGWRILDGNEQEINNFKLNLLTKNREVRTISLNFESELLPYDINVLIGPNGIGKSFSLKSLVEYWLQIGSGDLKILEKIKHTPFDVRPNIRRLILISYSPFEDFILALSKKDNLIDTDAYKYFGFRKERKNKTVGISRNLPKEDAAKSIIDCIYQDKNNSKNSWWVSKFSSVDTSLKTELKYDHIAVKVRGGEHSQLPAEDIIEIKDEFYLILHPELAVDIKSSVLDEHCIFQAGVFFVKNNKLIDLSSGQSLFTFIVINVVGAIRENSLVVIDEPELFLHPNLEIEFISLLKKTLKPFKSKAILATHSLAIVREVPSNCVHIFRDEGYGLDIVKPPFETFGGNMQRISTYVFGDKSESKPFDIWLKEMVKIHEPEQLIEMLQGQVNEEMIMKIMRLGKKNGL